MTLDIKNYAKWERIQFPESHQAISLEPADQY